MDLCTIIGAHHLGQLPGLTSAPKTPTPCKITNQ